jgi:hypothetical protein
MALFFAQKEGHIFGVFFLSGRSTAGMGAPLSLSFRTTMNEICFYCRFVLISFSFRRRLDKIWQQQQETAENVRLF